MKLKKEIGSQIRKLRKSRGWSQPQLAYKLEVSKQTVSNWETGFKAPRMGALQKLSDLFHVPIGYFTDSEKDLDELNALPNKIKRIPILGEIACGEPIIANENIEGYLEEPEDTLPRGSVFYLKAKGRSMEPTIPDGANVLIRQQPSVEENEIAAVLVNSDTEATLKRVKYQKDIIILVPDNSNYDPIIVNQENPAKILGKAIRFTTNL